MKTLERRLGLSSVISISVGAMLGSGLFVLPGLAMALTGPSVWLAYIVAGICVLPAALSKAELATAMPISGGSYVFIDRAFGPLAGTIGGIGLWLSLLLKSAFALVGFGAYLEVFADVPLKPVALALLAGVLALNTLGVQKVGKVQFYVVVASLLGLAVLVVWGLTEFHPSLLNHEFESGEGGFLAAVAFVYISYAGVTKVAAIAEEVKDPGRTLPLGILLSLACVTVLYGIVTLVMVGTVSAHRLAVGPDLHPVYTLGNTLGGYPLGAAAAVLAVLTMTSMANSGVLAASRFPFAMSREKLLPRPLSGVNSRYMTPVPAILLTGAVMTVAILTLDVARIAKLASAFMIAAFMALNVAVIVLREGQAQWYKPTFRAPFYPFTQIIGVVIGGVLLVMLGIISPIALTAVAIPGTLLFALYGRTRVDRSSVYGKQGPRQELAREAARRSTEFEARPPQSAEVLVPLFGHEHSPEVLLELAAGLTNVTESAGSTDAEDKPSVHVLALTAVPDQMAMEAMLAEDPSTNAARRRVGATADALNVDLTFQAVATRDVVKTVHEVSGNLRASWLVLEWRGRSERAISIFNPLGWLVNHLSCNLATFKDAGIRHIREILVLAAPGPHDALVVRTADHLSKIYGANICFVRFLPRSADDMLAQSEVDYLEQLQALCDQPSTIHLIRGDRKIDAITAVSGEYDLLITGAQGDLRFRDYITGSAEDKLTRKAACSVLRLKTPPGRTHQATSRESASSETEAPTLTDYFAPSLLRAQVPVDRKEDLFRTLGEIIAAELGDIAPSDVEAALWERERSQNTAVGQGLALPHATLSAAARPYVGVVTTVSPIDYQAPDGEPVDIFFFTLGPPSARNTHLKILGELSRLVMTTQLTTSIRSATTNENLRRAFDDAIGAPGSAAVRESGPS